MNTELHVGFVVDREVLGQVFVYFDLSHLFSAINALVRAAGLARQHVRVLRSGFTSKILPVTGYCYGVASY
jgi:hypothetical protein